MYFSFYLFIFYSLFIADNLKKNKKLIIWKNYHKRSSIKILSKVNPCKNKVNLAFFFNYVMLTKVVLQQRKKEK